MQGFRKTGKWGNAWKDNGLCGFRRYAGIYVETGGWAKAGMVRGSDAKECKKNPPTLPVDFHVLVGRGRLERPTNGLKVRCSTN